MRAYECADLIGKMVTVRGVTGVVDQIKDARAPELHSVILGLFLDSKYDKIVEVLIDETCQMEIQSWMPPRFVMGVDQPGSLEEAAQQLKNSVRLMHIPVPVPTLYYDGTVAREDPIVSMADLDAPTVAKCWNCKRSTWDPENVGKRCSMTQPDGSKCVGVFEIEVATSG